MMRDFEEFLSNLVRTMEARLSIPKEKGEDIVKLLKGGDVEDSKFKFWVKTSFNPFVFQYRRR